jgi:hypothetical protein
MIRSSLAAILVAAPISAHADPSPKVERVEFAGGFPVTTRQKIYPLSEVKRGDRGVGYTVLSEDRVTEFGVEVLGVLENMLGPNKPIILARLSGEEILFTGVIAGMSGSPVYVDGRLVGAVGYRFGVFSKEPIAGITPIETMLEVDGVHVETRPRTAALPPIGQTGIDVRAIRSHQPEPLPIPERPRLSAGPYAAQPIDTPLSISGAPLHVVEQLGARLSEAGFMIGSGSVAFKPRSSRSRQVEKNDADRAGTVKAAPIAPASPIAAVLMQGDLNIAAIGTVTMVEQGQVYAFGHPFVGWGHVAFPMYTAAILNTLASEAGSYKQGIAAREVGSITQDRLTAIAGRIGDVAPMVPLRVRIERGDRTDAVETMSFEIVDEQTWLPLMAEAAISSAAARRMGYEAGGTIDMDVRIHVKDRTLRVVDSYSAQSPLRVSSFVASDIASLIGTIERNDVEVPEVRGIEASLKISKDVSLASLVEVVADRTNVRPGETVRVTARLRRLRGDIVEVPLDVEVPRDFSGTAELYVGGGVEMDQREGDVYGTRYPTSLDELLGILAERRPARSLFAKLFTKSTGLRENAEVMTALPPSARAVLGAGQAVRTAKKIEERMGPDVRVPFSDVVVGGMSVPIVVVR